MSVCIECHAVETLEADGIGGRVCTACGHTLDDTECLTVEVTAGSGMRVSEGGGYFSLDPHSNVGKIREKVEASCTEACKRAGMGYADGRCWDFAMAYLSAKKVLAAYREVRDAAKVVRVRRACAALAGCGDGEEVEEARAALRRLCEGFDVDGGHNADTSTEEASRPSEDAFVALRFQIEAIVRTVSGGGSGEDGAKGVGEEVAEGVRSSLEAEVLRLDDTTGLVVAGGGGVVGGMVRAVRGRRGLREGEERALLRLLRSRDDVGREPDKARHFSLMSGDAELNLFFCCCLLLATSGKADEASLLASSLLIGAEPPEGDADYRSERTKKGREVYLIAESMRRTIEQSLVPDAPRPLPKVRGRAFGGCHREGDVKSGEHGDEGIGRIASAAGKVLQAEGPAVCSQVVATCCRLLELAKQHNLDTGRRASALDECILSLALKAHKCKAPPRGRLASALSHSAPAGARLVSQRRKELVEVLEGEATGMPVSFRGRECEENVLLILRHRQVVSGGRGKGREGMGLFPPAVAKKSSRWAAKVEKACAMVEGDLEGGRGAGGGEMDPHDLLVYRFVASRVAAGEAVGSVRRRLEGAGGVDGLALLMDGERCRKEGGAEGGDAGEFDRGGAYILSEDEVRERERGVGSRFDQAEGGRTSQGGSASQTAPKKAVMKRTLDAIESATASTDGEAVVGLKAKRPKAASKRVNYDRLRELLGGDAMAGLQLGLLGGGGFL